MNQRKLPLLPKTLRMVAWEITRSCNLACLHCRASSKYGPYSGELTMEECTRLIDEIVTFSNPVVILTGGEPLLRKDIFDVIAHGTAQKLRMVLATNGTLVSENIAREMRKTGIQRVSVSIDGKDSTSHDAFRHVDGAFDGALKGIEALKRVGMEFQINTTITKQNLAQLEDIMKLAISLGAIAHHIFLLVPTGRGKEMAGEAISPEEYERTLNWFYEQSLKSPIQLKATCAPHYFRIVHQKSGKFGRHGTLTSSTPHEESHSSLHSFTRGCLGGSSFCFISHTGQVQPCGYLEVDCGQIREKGFREIWNNSVILNELRDLNRYKGKCGRCPFITVCGGCRARAYEILGDYLGEEPFCVYQPK